jgi:hypothetical protein
LAANELASQQSVIRCHTILCTEAAAGCHFAFPPLLIGMNQSAGQCNGKKIEQIEQMWGEGEED